MKTKLLPTQVVDVDRMAAGMEVPNFSEPGTGKTLTTIGFIDRMKFQGGLILCPVIATTMWKEVLEYELGCKAQIVSKGGDSISKLADFHVMPYSMADKHYSAVMEGSRDIIVADESHYLKSWEAKRTQAVFGYTGSGQGGFYETCQQLICLSGTPIERYADDIWSQIRATQPEALAKYRVLSLAEFQDEFCFMEDKSYSNGAVLKRVSVRTMNERKLNRLLYEEIGAVRRVMDDVAKDMPPVRTVVVTIPAVPNADLRYLLSQLPKDEASLEDLLDTEHLATIRRLVGSSKVPLSADYIEAACDNGPVVVGFWHRTVADELRAILERRNLRVAVISGMVPQARRMQIKEAFIAGELDVLLGQITSMGVALDGLQHASNRVMVLEDDFAPSRIEQFYKRIWRMGQTSPVLLEFLRAADNVVDDAVARVRERKTKSTGIVMAQEVSGSE